MTHERERARGYHGSPARTVDDDLAPGRANRSSELAAPSTPIASGLLLRKAARDGNGVAADANLAVATAASSAGASLPEPIMRKFESSLGADLSSVRVHTGADSAAAASAVGARAYTTGQDIHFGAGHYDPSSHDGEHLLAHEVAHTVQQRGGTPVRQNKLEVSTPYDAAEHEADRAAEAMVFGRSATIGGFAPTVALMRDAKPTNYVMVATVSDARDNVLDAMAEAINALDRTGTWLRDQWTEYIGITAESPAVVWDPGLLKRGVALGAAKGIGAATGAVSAVASTLPEIGWLLAKAIDVLGDKLKDTAKEGIEGGKTLTAEQASDAGRAASSTATIAKHGEVDAALTQAKLELRTPYKNIMHTLGADRTAQAEIDATMSWCDNAIATSRAVRPVGDSILQSMLATWLGRSSFDAHTAKKGVNPDSWKRAAQKLYGTDDIPGQSYWAMQLRKDWQHMGLPTEKADGWLHSGAHMPAGEAIFDSALDREALLKGLALKETNPIYLHIVQGGDFRLTCRFATAIMAPDSNLPGDRRGYVYLAGKAYILETVGLVGEQQTVVRSSGPEPNDRSDAGE